MLPDPWAEAKCFYLQKVEDFIPELKKKWWIFQGVKGELNLYQLDQIRTENLKRFKSWI